MGMKDISLMDVNCVTSLVLKAKEQVLAQFYLGVLAKKLTFRMVQGLAHWPNGNVIRGL